MAEWLKALVSKTGIPFTGYRGFESPFFRKGWKGIAAQLRCLFCRQECRELALVND